MVIQALAKWINQNFPECATKTERDSVKCNTLFIDAFQLYFNVLEKSDNKTFVKKFLGTVKNAILSNHPSDTIFVFFDGPCPAIKFQKLRERWFLSYHVDDYVIDTDEYNLKDVKSNDDDGYEALQNYLERVINYDDVKANSIIYSSVTTPGEAKYKFFDYFREMKNDPDFIPSRKHIIMSNTNEMFFLALQFIDEQFYILKLNHVLYDVALLRDLILYHMAIEEPFPGLNDFDSIDEESVEKRKSRYKRIVSKMNDELKQQIINDVVALSIVVSSENFAPFQEFEKMGTNAYTYSKVLNSYKELNQPYIAKKIKRKSKSENSDENPKFTPLIVDNCFDLSSFKKIMKKFLQMYCEKNQPKNKKTSSSHKIKGKHESKKDKKSKSKCKVKSKTKIKSKPKSINIFDVGMTSKDEENNSDQEEESDNSNSYKKHNESESDNSNSESDRSESDDDISENDDDSDDDDSSENDDDSTDFTEESQQLFRLFNFTWQLYTKGCISWSFYYQFKKSPPLKIALDLMQQEGLDVFDTKDSKEITEPMLKDFIIYPVEVDNLLPYCLYKLKFPDSPIAHFWPLGATDPKDIPIIDLKTIKKFYKKAKKKIDDDDLPEGEIFTETYEIVKKPLKRKISRPQEESIFNQARYRFDVNMFDDF